MKLIQDDAQYERAREALLKIAAELDDPLSSMTGEERERKNLIYDRTAEAAREYRRSEMVVVFPGLKQVYQKSGVPFRDFSKSTENEPEIVPEAPTSSNSEPVEAPIEDDETSTPPEPERPPVEPAVLSVEKPKAAVNLSAWLDD